MELKRLRKTLLDQLKLACREQMVDVPVSTVIGGALEIVENNGRMYAKGDYALIYTDYMDTVVRLYMVQNGKATILHEGTTSEHGHGFYMSLGFGYEFIVSADDIRTLFLA